MQTQEQLREELVAKDVFLCMSMWMEDVLKNPEHEYYEEALNLTSKVDYESALDDSSWELEQNDNGLFYLIDYSEFNLGNIRIFDWGTETIDEFPKDINDLPWECHLFCSDDINEAIKLCFEEDDIEPEGIETLEYWAVSRFLADKLEREGEPVEEINGTLVWGRQTSGQAIAMDGIIDTIAQKYLS